MTWTWFPWRRWRQAELLAEAAEESLAEAVAEHDRAKALADEARSLKTPDGFTDAVRTVFG